MFSIMAINNINFLEYPVAHERTAKSLGIELIHLPLIMGRNKKEWKSSVTGKFELVETAVLDYYVSGGWHGYAGEGGLILNLIKAMSFPKIDFGNRSTFIEALYAQNVAFEKDRFEIDWLLSNVRKATASQVKNNFEVMSSSKVLTIDYGGFSSSSNISMLDFFPSLKLSMFLELLEALGNNKIFEIAKIFSIDPYEYRKGWPDLTIWKNGIVKFLEVKSPGDSLHQSQKKIIRTFIKPLKLNFALIDVNVSNGGD